MCCKECFESMLRPWFSIPNLLLLAAVAFVVALIWPDEDGAAWVQAFGSIAAIIGAAWFPYLHEARKAEQEAKAFKERIRGLSLHLLLQLNELTRVLYSNDSHRYDGSSVVASLEEIQKDLTAVAVNSVGSVSIADLLFLKAAASQSLEHARVIRDTTARGNSIWQAGEAAVTRRRNWLRKTERELGDLIRKLDPSS